MREITPGWSGNNRFAYVRTYKNAKGDGGKRDGESARATRLQHVHRGRMLRRLHAAVSGAHRARVCACACMSAVCARDDICIRYTERDAYPHTRAQYGVLLGAHGLTTTALLGNVRVPRSCVGVARGWRSIYVVLRLLLRIRTMRSPPRALRGARWTREKNERWIKGTERDRERQRRVCLHACTLTPPRRLVVRKYDGRFRDDS